MSNGVELNVNNCQMSGNTTFNSSGRDTNLYHGSVDNSTHEQRIDMREAKVSGNAVVGANTVNVTNHNPQSSSPMRSSPPAQTDQPTATVPAGNPQQNQCECGRCPNAIAVERRCCLADTNVWRKLRPFPHLKCISQHPGFDPCCLNVWVLGKNYNRRKRNGSAAMSAEFSQPKKLKLTAEFEYLEWLDSRLLPSCVEKALEIKFPETFVGDGPQPLLE